MNNNSKKPYDVAIVGGGITGTSLLYVLSKYTNLQKLVLLDKYEELAHVNSHFNNNSQTLHFGDIETNYSLAKAEQVKEASSLLAGYAEKFSPDAILLSHKMVLAVGNQEVQELERRYWEFRGSFPNLKKISRMEIAAIEPKVVEGRDPKQEILALLSDKGYALDYQKISVSFVEESMRQKKEVDIFLKRKVISIVRDRAWWKIMTSAGEIVAKVVIVASGPHSLIFARSLGYGRELGILPVAGSFYRSSGLLRGKVYTMQIKKLPFAAVHGDPNVNDPAETRFGPTAKVLPLLERHNWGTLMDFLRTSVFTWDGVSSLFKIITDRTIFLYVVKNLLFDLPWIGKRMFLKEVQKIVPTMKIDELEYGKGLGGIRPQVVNTIKKKMEMGEAKIIGKDIIFDITPSPGASVCLDNARKNALEIGNFLEEYDFDEKRFEQDHKFEY
ncbi:MAG TPA: FAD-dependent oxidoreductase [Candidatus Moranbacteria bacterium]|nr:FAD-dependent oxidoreductase [Candidatus Moranbacteria bacterium]